MAVGQDRLEQIKRKPAEGRIQLRELAVEADVSAVVIVLEPIGPQEGKSLGIGRVAKRDQPSFSAGHDLRPAQAEDGGVAEGAQGRITITPTEPMGGVKDQLEIVLSGQGFQRLDVRGQAEVCTAAMPTVRGVIRPRASSTSMQ